MNRSVPKAGAGAVLPVAAATGPVHDSALDDALRAMRDAAQLVRYCDGAWRDQVDRADGWHVDYAVDVDVIRLYAVPEDRADYAEVFHGPGQAQLWPVLARLLGDAILLRLAGHVQLPNGAPGALFMVTAHAQEYERVSRAIALQALAQSAQAEDALVEVVDHLASARGDQSLPALVRRLVREHRALIQAFDGESGPLRTLKRLAALPGGRLLNLSRAQAYSGYRSADGVATGQPRLLPRVDGADASDRIEFFARVEFWLGALKKHASGKRKRNLLDDAQVLATLEWVNRCAFDQRRQVVLVSGTRSLFLAGDGVQVRAADGQLTTFSRAYLRDPRAFIAQRDFLPLRLADHSLDPDGLGVLDWLNQFFPRAVSQEQRLPVQDTTGQVVRRFGSVNLDALDLIESQADAQLRDDFKTFVAAQRAHSGAKGFPDNLLAEWAAVVKGGAASEAVTPDAGDDTSAAGAPDHPLHRRAERFVALLNERLGRGLTVAGLQAELRNTVHQAVQRLYLATGDVGVLQVVGDGELVRGVPALRLEDNYPLAAQWCDRLGQALWEPTHTFDFSAMYADLMAEDPSGYHSHLVHALAYSAGGHWLLTRQYCHNALNIAERLKRELPQLADRKGRHGREAAYLLAVAERRVAQRSADLDAARQWLDRAGELDFERPGLRDARFEAEALAIEVTNFQFVRFARPTGKAGSVSKGSLAGKAGQAHTAGARVRPSPGRPAAPAPLPPTLLRRLADARSLLEAVYRPLHVVPGEVAGDPPIVYAWVTRQVATNVLLLALYAVADGRPTLTAAQVAGVVYTLDVFRERQLAPDSPEVSTRQDDRLRRWNSVLSGFVYSVAVLVFLSDVERRSAAMRYLAQVDQDNLLAKLHKPRAPFEKQRFELFKATALRCAGQPLYVTRGTALP